MPDAPPAPAEDGYHYQVIARAIRALDAHEGAPVPLARLAADLGMSPAHFQRVFSAWAGVSPKKYQEYLALGHARALASAGVPLVEVAQGAGLSGPGRLHDLFLRWEAMSPGQAARAGAGLCLRWGWFDTAFGPALVMASDLGISGLAFAAETGPEAAFADLAGRWPAARLREAPAEIAPWVKAALGPAMGARGGPAPLHVLGAPFQIKVWEALLRVPAGGATSYAALAEAIGRKGAARAVGTAVGRNPVSFLIPCHRVLRGTGALGGYHWGLGVKRALLAWEGARAEAPTA
ncbi:methylated-DNA--[protein]-cysteine S-methyltransferase [Phaeovulum vinaykumarii]|nr:bifunctional helix-turn-helix domain-containing protein/methylated-DNA--[protein]-cysteine S-methyltransferase [Phaeovulum vinaykumarii]